MPSSTRTAASRNDIAALKKQIRKPGGSGHAKVCVYGANGSGKTRFAGSGPATLLIDCNEEGDRSIQDNENVRVLPATRWQTVGDAYWYLKGGNHPFKAVALDTITEMNVLALDFVLNEAEERDPTREKQTPDKRTWGRAGQLMRGMLLAYRNLPMHVIFAAQQRIIRDEDTGEIIEITVDLPNSSRGTSMGCVGVLGRMLPQEVRVKVDGRTRKRFADHLIVGTSEIMRTKDRTNNLGQVVRNPTMPMIIEAWQSRKEK